MALRDTMKASQAFHKMHLLTEMPFTSNLDNEKSQNQINNNAEGYSPGLRHFPLPRVLVLPVWNTDASPHPVKYIIISLGKE